MDLPGGTDGLPAAGADQLAGAAGPLAVRQRVGSRLLWSPGSRADYRRQAGPPDLDFVPTF